MSEVFCKDCAFLEFTGICLDWDFSTEVECRAPENLKRKTNWYEEWFLGIKNPKKINKYNDCKWYKSKNKNKPPKKP